MEHCLKKLEAVMVSSHSGCLAEVVISVSYRSTKGMQRRNSETRMMILDVSVKIGLWIRKSMGWHKKKQGQQLRIISGKTYFIGEVWSMHFTPCFSYGSQKCI